MPLHINGWRVMAHPLMIGQLLKLVAAVRQVAAKDPSGLDSNPNTKLLAALVELMFTEIPADPRNRKYEQGGTLGKEHKNWFRAKFGNGRFRLFFRFSTNQKTIIFAWVNDQNTLRTYRAKTDAYKVFRGMLDDGNPPADWPSLAMECEAQTGLEPLRDEISKLIGGP